MIAYIKGLLTESTISSVIIDVSGIGYKIYIPVNLHSKLPPLQQNVLLYTSFIIRENSQTLYGFLSGQERDLFEALQNVTGIGPKVALCIIGHITAINLHAAISQHDIMTLSKIPGIGKKTAERLIIEMRDKLNSLFPQHDFAEYAIKVPADAKTLKINDAMSALISLGYNQGIAQKAIKKTLKDMPEENLDLSTLITAALQNIN
jgi:Holliday junction DNA helicase RuvA